MSSYNEYAVKQRYGRTPSSDDDGIAYLKAVKVIIGADGEIAPGEAKALEAGAKRFGLSAAVKKELDDFDFKSAKLDDVLPSMKKGGLRARMLLRDAIEISSADGTYADEERAAVHQAAEKLGVSAETVKSIEALVELERGVRHLRKTLFPKKK